MELTVEQFKELVIWAREQNIASLSVNGATVSFFPNLPTLSDYNLEDVPQDKLLFHSSEGS